MFPVTNYEKKVFAEVSTPLMLIEQMLAKMPSIFWTKPQKIFEPCCGKGGFVLSLFKKLFSNLKIESEKERTRTILEECLYFSDINESNIEKTKELLLAQIPFKYEGKFNTHIGDSLAQQIPLHFFDLVVTNPPFNASYQNKNIIWPNFVKMSLTKWLKKEEGLLLFISPPGWRKPDKSQSKYSGLFKLMTQQNQMLYLEMNDKKHGRTTFNCNIFYDWYLIKTGQGNPLIRTTIVDILGAKKEIDLTNWSWFPNSNIDEILFLSFFNSPTKNEKEYIPILYSRSAYGSDKIHMSPTISEEYKYPCIHSTLKKEIRYMYSNRNDRGFFGQSKVIFGESGIYTPILDWEGKYGMTHCAMAIEICSLEEGKKICEALISPKFQEIIKSCICSSFRIDWTIFKEFRRDFFVSILKK
jgi:hypothetical protein